MSKKKKTQKSTTTVAPSAFAQPFVSDAASTLRPAYDEGMAIQRQFQPGLLAASQFYGDTIGGKYLDGNPYVDDMIAQGDREITDAVNSEFMGRFASGRHATALANALADNRTRLRFGNYNQERAYQNDAGRNLAGLATTATALPSIPSQTYTGGVGGLLGNYVTQDGKVVQKSSGGLGGLLGTALSLGASFIPGGNAAKFGFGGL